MKIAIIGAGNIAKYHLTAVKYIDDLDVVGVYDLNYQRAQSFEPIVKAYQNINNLINKVDGVIITTPNNTHANYTTLAIENNKHVLCEKPMAISVDEAEQMTKQSLNSKLCCHVGFNYRFLSIFQILKQLVENNAFGAILSVDMEIKKNLALTRKKYSWRDSAGNMATSGALGDLGIHLIDMLHYLFSSEINLNNYIIKAATYVPEKEDIPVYVDDYAVINGMLNNGIYFKLLASNVALPNEAEFSIKIIGTKKEVYYDSNMKDSYLIKSTIYWDTQKLAFDRFSDDYSNEIYGWGESFVVQLANWARCINYGENTNNATFSDGLKGQKALSAFLNKEKTRLNFGL